MPPSNDRPPLGLPRGSVRACLTLLIVAVVIAEVARGREVDLFWTETLMIALAHYFSTRRFLQLSPELMRRLESEGHLESEAYPLYLPRNSIRAAIFLVFVGLAVWLYRQGRIMQPKALAILGIVFAYLLGVIARGIVGWWTQGRQTTALRGWEDIKAALVVLVLGLVAGAYLAGRPDLVPIHLRNVALGLVLFYFGSR